MILTIEEKSTITISLKYAIKNIRNGDDDAQSKRKRIDDIKELISKINKL